MNIIDRILDAVSALTENKARIDELTKRVAHLEEQVAAIPSWATATTFYNIVPPLPR